MTTTNKFTIILTVMLVTILSFNPVQTKAQIKDEMYLVPWSESQYYVILDFGDKYRSIVSNSPIRNDGLNYLNSDTGVSMWYTEFSKAGVTWTSLKTFGSAGAQGGNPIVYANHDILDSEYNLVFPLARFLSPSIMRQRAQEKAIQEMMITTSQMSGTILPVGLAVLSMLLVVGLITWLRRFLT